MMNVPPNHDHRSHPPPPSTPSVTTTNTNHEYFCPVITDTFVPQTSPPQTSSISSLLQIGMISIDEITLRIIIPTYIFIIVWYIILRLSHPVYIVSSKQNKQYDWYHYYYHRIISCLLSFVVPGIRMIPSSSSSSSSWDDDAFRTDDDAVPKSNDRNHLNDTNVNSQATSLTRSCLPIPAQDDDEIQEGEEEEQQQPINMSGSYQMTYHENLDAFLSVQGVPWPLRRAASAVLPIHHITHIRNHVTIQIVAPSSGFTTQTQYVIQGPPVETNVRGRIFSDRVYYSYEEGEDGEEDGGGVEENHPKRKCNGIITEKRAVTEGYIVTVFRKLVTITDPNNNNNNNNNERSSSTAAAATEVPLQQIHMTSTVSFPNESNKENVVCIQMFDRIK